METYPLSKSGDSKINFDATDSLNRAVNLFNVENYGSINWYVEKFERAKVDVGRITSSIDECVYVEAVDLDSNIVEAKYRSLYSFPDSESD